MSNDNTITAIILCKNAEATLQKTLDSVAFCDHVIVGDDGSTDESVAIAKKFHADSIKLSRGMNYSQKRNYLLQYAQTEWVIYIDSDEIISKPLREEILLQIKSTGAQGFLIKRMDIFMGRMLRHGETASTWLLRLARKNAGTWERAVHETWEVSGKIERLDGELLHYSHPDLEEFMDKINMYTQLEAEARISKSYFLSLISYLQLFFFPPAKFIQNYILRMGFLDGFPGFVIAWMMSLHSLCVRIKILEKKR
jgi:glycosyltransferase involved in cell wall biosynthesis